MKANLSPAPPRAPRFTLAALSVARLRRMIVAILSVALACIALTCLMPASVDAAPTDPSMPTSELAAPDSIQPLEATAGQRVLLPLVQVSWAGSTTGASYATIPVEPPPTDRPAPSHGDLNLALRGYSPTSARLILVDYDGGTDPGAPQMRGIFADNQMPQFTSAYQVYDWDWGCGPNGCRGNLLTTYPVTLLGMATRAGELLAAPSRGAEIYPGGYTILVLYAEPARLTLKYTRNDNVVSGYTVHLEKLSVDTKLLELYQQADAAGRWQLPALKNGQPLGRAAGGEVLVAVRDCGTFMDPRAKKDWWQ